MGSLVPYSKKLIEVALPLEAISAASAREKYIRHGHPSTLHLWWARRPLAACRAVIFASLVDDPNDPDAPPAFVQACRELPRGKNTAESDTPRQRLFDFIETLVRWESTTDEDVLETARRLIRLSTGGEPPPLLDPFAGGGSIPLEAQRLGLEAHASDLNPVAVMICKALIEIPPKFAHRPPVNPRDREMMGGKAGWKGAAGLAADVRYYGQWMRERAWERIGHLYPPYIPPAGGGDERGGGETVIAWLWARTVRCPNPACGAQMPLVKSFWLSKKRGRKAWVEPVVDRQAKTVRFTVETGDGKPPDPPKVGRGAKFRCLVCGEVAPDQHLKDEGMAGRMGAQLMAVVTEGKSGRSYYAPMPEHEQIAATAQPGWAPAGELSDNARWFSPPLFGMTDFVDLFTPRQLVALTTFSELVAEARQQIHADAVAAGLPDDDVPLRDGGAGARAYAEAVSVYLAFGVSRQANRLSTICFWDTQRENIQQVFARQAIPMTWDYVEANPFSNSTGNFMGQLTYPIFVLDSLRWTQPGKAKQEDATKLSYSHRIVLSTDPPYYDNIGYADLSDFFYLWLRQGLEEVYPDVFSTLLVPKEPELVATSDRFEGDMEAANRHFETGLMQAFTAMRTITEYSYPLTVFYAFKQSEVVVQDESQSVSSTGWETMLEGLVCSGYRVCGTWPMRTEATKNLKKNVNALASSIVLVCRPRSDDAPMASRRDFVNALRKELPEALREMQSGNIAPVDLAQASIGPGMAVYSRYSKVLEPNGDALTVRTALQLINHELDAYLAEQEGVIDEDSRFAVAWFQQFGFEEGPFGQADVLARAKNTSVEGLAYAGVLQSGAGRVRLYRWDELDPGWDPTTDERLAVWEAVHHLIERLNTHGEEGAARLLARLPSDVAAQARQLAYRLYSICERKGWAEHARDYNALVISWGASQEQAREFKEQYQQGKLL
jgi:putative DNA methylase